MDTNANKWTRTRIMDTSTNKWTQTPSRECCLAQRSLGRWAPEEPRNALCFPRYHSGGGHIAKIHLLYQNHQLSLCFIKRWSQTAKYYLTSSLNESQNPNESITICFLYIHCCYVIRIKE